MGGKVGRRYWMVVVVVGEVDRDDRQLVFQAGTRGSRLFVVLNCMYVDGEREGQRRLLG